uniref:Sec-independent translocase component C n=1 Tax=Porphyridium aerugineum TaxID=2792 RepID=UPI001FCCF1C3|nr:Sec-independent translocase component C [Porphyridium aerugineum]UNJ17864.1 Sec-independent translocase component C [Porphyridium aerugineum]
MKLFMNIPKIEIEEKKMPLIDHLNELRSRLLLSLLFFILSSAICSLKVKQIVFFLQQLVPKVKFLQLAPGEYFFSSIKVALYGGLLFTTPFLIYQLLLFILPGLSFKERRIILPLSLMSVILFFLGLAFAYLALIPAALNFFLNYGSDIVEPLWSLEQYLDFIVILSISTGISFELPIIQILLGVFGIVTKIQMLKGWRYVLLLSTIAGAILTPSVDPLTQILLSSAIFLLYFLGIIFLYLVDNIFYKRED